MDVTWIGAESVKAAAVEDLPGLLARDDGWVWVDVETLDPPARALLDKVFGFHERALHDCAERNHVPKIHVYADHLFTVMHSPERGAGGHVHYLELDQFVGPRYLVTVHGPTNPVVPADACLRETRAVAARLRSGRLRVQSPLHLSYAVVSAIVRHEEEFVAQLAHEVGLLEQRVMAGSSADPEAFLDELYQARHELLTVRTMAAQTQEIYGRGIRLAGFVSGEDRVRLEDLFDQYQRIHRITDGQLAFLQGVTEYFRARTDTKMAIAAERLAVIAALTLPITALSSVMGMNVIVNSRTHWGAVTILVAAMSVMSFWLLRWARRHGWW
jgi:Mg2+ and Co2+ transporter CorA